MFYEDDDGQMTFSNISTDKSNMVVQANALIKSRQDLSLNEKKLICIIISQIVADDMEFKPYIVSPSELAGMVGNMDSVNMYHNAQDICDSIMRKHLEIRSEDGSWKKIQWVSMCEYNSKTKKIQILLNDNLKPYLIGLAQAGYYAQFAEENILPMNSIYSIRLFELINEAIKTKILPQTGTRVRINKSDIIDACMMYKRDHRGKILIDSETKEPVEKYNKLSMFKKRVIQTACEEISELSMYYVPYESDDPDKCVKFIKKGREVVAFDFYVNMIYREPNSISKNTYFGDDNHFYVHGDEA